MSLDGEPHFVYPSTKIPELTGRVAVCRGSLVYCFEGADNDREVLSLSLKQGGKLSAGKHCAELGGAVRITAEAFRTASPKELYTSELPKKENCVANAIPYYAWANRGENQMRVRMAESV